MFVVVVFVVYFEQDLNYFGGISVIFMGNLRVSVKGRWALVACLMPVCLT